MANCASCKAEILWIKLPSGKAMPVNPKRVGGSINAGTPRITIVTDGGNVISVLKCPEEFVSGAPLQGYESHFATCPNAKEHRK